MFQFLQMHSMYVMSTFEEVLKDIYLKVLFILYPLYSSIHASANYIYIIEFLWLNDFWEKNSTKSFLCIKSQSLPLPFCSKRVESAWAAAWKTSLEEECISMDSITSLCAGNLSKSQPHLSLHSPAAMLTLSVNCSSAGMEAEPYATSTYKRSRSWTTLYINVRFSVSNTDVSVSSEACKPSRGPMALQTYNEG